MTSGALPCPACGFLTLGQAYGSYDLCPVCDWEDDGLQLANPTSGGGANGESLAQAQALVLQRYPAGVEIATGHRRSPRWRTLSAPEIAAADAARATGPWSRDGIRDESGAYWFADSP